MSLTDIKSIHYYPVIKVKVIKVIKIFGRKYFPYSISLLSNKKGQFDL